MMKPFNNQGSALAMVIILFAILSLLGTTILFVASSEHRFTQIDSISQSAYYIAESGINYMMSTINNKINNDLKDSSTAELFFQEFEKEFTESDYILDNFQENFGEQPIAIINVKKEESGENYRDYRDYKIESIGNIGSSSRVLYSVIKVKWSKNQSSSSTIPDGLLFYTKEFQFKGQQMHGVGGISVSDGITTHNLDGGHNINISNMFFNGAVLLHGTGGKLGSSIQPGTIYVNGDFSLTSGGTSIYGDVRVKGNFDTATHYIYGNVYVDGDLILGFTPTIHKNIYYTGEISYPNNYPQNVLDRCIKVDNVEDWQIPVRDVSLRDDNWYLDNGYTVKGNVNETIPDNGKWFVDSFTYTGWPAYSINGDGIYSNVVIVSKGDINIATAKGFTGALIAPNGVVTIPSGSPFTGVIISKNGIDISSSGSTANLQMLQDLFSDEDIPVIFSLPSMDDNDDSSESDTSGNIKVVVITRIKEK
jgi:formylmethanofuran dehydrogenase subunit C